MTLLSCWLYLRRVSEVEVVTAMRWMWWLEVNLISVISASGSTVLRWLRRVKGGTSFKIPDPSLVIIRVLSQFVAVQGPVLVVRVGLAALLDATFVHVDCAGGGGVGWQL